MLNHPEEPAMFRYKLRTLLILLAILPPIVAVVMPPLLSWQTKRPVQIAAPATMSPPTPHAVASVDPDLVYKIVTTLLNGTPDVRISLDRNTGTLWVSAKPSVQKTVQAIMTEMQKHHTQITTK
jgi:hypothetical protein